MSHHLYLNHTFIAHTSIMHHTVVTLHRRATYMNLLCQPDPPLLYCTIIACIAVVDRLDLSPVESEVTS